MNQMSPISASQESTRSRYPGTRSFRDSAQDQALFFGRDPEGEQLYLRVLSVSLLVQFAKSGLGKTSLLQASLFPRLRQKPFLPVMVRLDAPAESPVDAVARSFEQACKAEGLKLPEVRRDGLWELLSTALVWRGDFLLTPVLVFDQFEEVFTLRDRAFRDRLAEELGALATGVAPERLRSKHGDPERFKAAPEVKVVISLREDYLGPLEEFSPAIPNLFHERLRLEPLNADAAREAIARPAQLLAKDGEEPFWAPRFQLDGPALDKMIDYLEGGSGVIEPFALQLLCRHAEQIAHAKGEKGDSLVRLTLADFNEGKDFGQVLKTFYRDSLAKVEEKLGKAARANAEELCEHGLLDRDGRRLLLEEGQIRDQYGVNGDTLGILGQERLILRERRLESTFCEICHDRLAESIYASRRNKLPKKEQEQREREQQQLKTEQQQTRKLQTVVHSLTALSVALVLAFIVLGIAGWRWFEDERRIKDMSTKAEGFLGFMLGENFLGEIREMGRTSTLEKVLKATSQQAYDVRRPTLVSGLALRNDGDIERNKGHLKLSLRLFQQALDVIRESPDTPEKTREEKMREIARTHDRLADAIDASGKINDALSHYQAEVGAWRDVLGAASQDESETADDCTALADALASSGYVENRMGDATRGLKDLNEALGIVSGLLIGAQSSTHPECRLSSDKIEAYPNARALMVLSEIKLARPPFIFGDESETALPLAKTVTELMPSSTSASKVASLALFAKGAGETGLAALDDFRKAVAQSEALQARDPDNKLLTEQRAVVQSGMGQTIANCNSDKTNGCACPAGNCDPTPLLPEAEAMTLEAVATVRALAQSDQDNLSWESDLAWALQTYAKVLAKPGQVRTSELLKALNQSEVIYLRLERDDNPETVAQAASFLEDEAEALVDLQGDRSRAAMQSAIDRWRKLVAAHDSNSGYLAALRDGLGQQQALLTKLGDRAGADAATKEQLSINTKNSAVQETANRLAEEYSADFSRGEKLFEDKKYHEALVEFGKAEREVLEFMNHSQITAVTYLNLYSIYAMIADTQKELGNNKEQAAALGASMHAAEVAAALDPAQLPSLVDARIGLLSFYFGRKRPEGSMLSFVGQMVAEADRLAREEGQDELSLWERANANFALSIIPRADTKDVGREEAIRSGILDDERAAAIDKKDARYPKEAGVWREKLAKDLEEESPTEAEEARHERQLALKDYQEAETRDPADDEIKKAIRDLTEQGVK